MTDIIGSADADILFGTSGSDSISGGGSDDRLYGGAGGDDLSGGGGADTIYGESGDDVIDGGDGNDVLRAGAGNDLVHGGEGDDYLLSTLGSDLLFGDAGDDDFSVSHNSAGSSSISVSGGLGNDYLFLATLASGNTLTADMGEGNDEVYFNSIRGAANLTLGAGRDILYGSSNFSLLASTGNSILVTDWEGGAEGDFLNVADILTRETNWNGSVNPFSAGYLKLVQSYSNVILSYSKTANGVFANLVVFQNTTLAAFTSENFGGWSPDGTVAAGRNIVGTDAAVELLTGGSGDDLIEGGEGFDRAYGGAGNDEIRGDGGNDRLAGGAGNDDLQGGDGNDLIFADGGDDIAHGGEGDDYIEDSAGNGSIYGEGGDDDLFIQRVTGTAAATVYLSGGDGNDSIRVNFYNSSQVTVDAGAGDDFVSLNGNTVSHTVTLGDGADVVSYSLNNYGAMSSASAGVTRITDFQAGDSGDRVKIGTPYTTLGSDPFGSGYLRLVQTGADVLLQYDLDGASSGHGWITLLTLANTDASAFTPYNLSVYSFGGATAPELLLAGTAGDDRIHGNYAADVIDGGDGDDLIEGLGGDDELSGGLGADQLVGDSGADHLVGGDGDDNLSGGNDNDLLEGGEGADTISLGYGDDVAFGGGGNDSISVDEPGNDTAHGGDGDDYIELTRSGSEHIVLNGDAGNDRIFVTTSGGTALLQVDIDGGTGDDRIVLTSRTASRVTLGAGRDVLELLEGFRLDGSVVVTDFQAGEGGDMLDFDGWLLGFAQTLDPNANPFLTGTMRLVQSGADVLVQIDSDGAGSTAGWVTAVTLQNVDITALRPANLDNYQLLYQHGTEAADTLDGGGFDDWLYGEGGNDTIRGFAGADNLYGGEGGDSIQAGDGADTVQGEAGDDVIEGGAGVDSISGGEGSDGIDGGTENDTLNGDGGNDVVAGGDGNDFVFGDGGDDVLTGGAGADALIGDLGDDSLDGGDGDDNLFSDVFDAAPQHDIAIGGAGIDLLQVEFFDILGAPGVTMTIAADAAGGYAGTISAGADYGVAFSTVEMFGIGGTDQADQMTTGDGTDLLIGRLGDDVLSGGGGADWLIGGGGADVMIGGAGNDRYDVDSESDVLVENEGEGTDLVETQLAAYALLANFENLTGLLATGQILTGNGAANVIKGGSGNDVIDGGAGADSMQGGSGNDTYYVDNVGDVVSDSGGIEEIHATLAYYGLGIGLENLTGLVDTGQTLVGNTQANTIRGGGGNDQLNGGNGIDTLYGGAGNDSLDGGTGGDSMRGEQGDDSYLVDSASDAVIEAAGEGIDKVTTALASYALGANVENLTGSSTLGQSLRGNVLDNEITGGGGADTIRLEDGGTDKAFGNGGNDTLYFGNAFTVADTPDGGSGTDTLSLQGVYSGLVLGPASLTGIEVLALLGAQSFQFGGMSGSASYDISTIDQAVGAGALLTVDGSGLAAAETLAFDGSAELDGRFDLRGGAGADRLTGGALADTLNGGGGADTLAGGLGDDLYFADGFDSIVEAAGAGADEVRTSAAAFTLADNLETLTGLSSSGQTLTGNSGANTVTGGSGADVLYGGGGTDTLTGNAGNDTLRVSAPGQVTATGGAGIDTLLVDWSGATDAVVSAPGPGVPGLDGVHLGFNDGGSRSVMAYGIDAVDITTGGGNDNIRTGPGNDRAILGGGDDRADVGAGTNVADGGSGTDGIGADLRAVTGATAWDLAAGTHSGFSGSYTNFEYFLFLETGSGNDSIVTGASALRDIVYTYAGNDTASVFAGNDTVYMGTGFDTLIIDYSAATGPIQTWSMITTAEGFGGSLGDTVDHNVSYGGIDRFIFTGGSASDYIITAEGDDVLRGGGGDDYLDPTNGNDTLHGEAGDDRLIGGAGSDTLVGGAGNDGLNGGGGVDSMTGGIGDDSYVIDEAGDVATELEGEGTDTISTFLVAYVLGATFENLTGLRDGGQSLTGNSGANVITGWSGNDIIDGRAGADRMDGQTGDDVYIVDDLGDVVAEGASRGTDEVRTALVSYSLTTNVENLTGTSSGGQTLTGNSAANRITGGDGNDTLDGGSGLDVLVGGLGDDVYFDQGTEDQIVEAANGGTDEVRSDRYIYSIAAFANVEYLTGTSNSGQTLTGNGGANRIAGGQGDDVIDGGAGADALIGGLGNDIYVIDNAADTITEAAESGFDEIRTALATYTLASANVEVLTGTSSLGQTLIGNESANRIKGGDGNDVLDGGGAGDFLTGGLGDDIYIVTGWDVVTEAAGGGFDEMRTAESGHMLAAEVEKLTGLSSSGQWLRGNALNNEISGGSGDDTIDGGAGHDLIDGGAGADELRGEAGSDTYRVDDVNDKVVELVDEGSDKVETTLAAYTLGANVEDLQGLLDTGQTLTGNLEVNVIAGGGGDDVLDAGGGFGDDLHGNGGDDRFLVSVASAVWISGGSGIDTVVVEIPEAIGAMTNSLTAGSEGYYGLLSGGGGLNVYFQDVEAFDLTTGASDDEIVTGSGDDRLVLNGGDDRAEAGGGADVVDGGAGNDMLAGGDGDDLLDGGLGDDSMTGGAGDDIYVVDSAGDSILELAGDGTDEVRTSLAAYTLAGGIEKLTALGSLGQVLTGNGFDNVIDGGAGVDTMAGRAGDDIYIVDDAGDSVIENEGEGIDEIRTSLSYFSLANLPDVENLTGTSGSVQFLVGNDSNNVIKGGDSYDYIVGGLGADTMVGGDGGDDYSVDNVGDVVVELATGTGIDLIRTSLAVYSLFGSEVEMLLAESNINHDFRGSTAHNHIAGAAGHDLFRLQDGGNDIALGGSGNDVFLFGSTMDGLDVVDGGAGADQIALQGGAAFTFGSGVVGVESIGLLSGSDTRFGGPGGLLHSYGLTTLDSNVAAGALLTVDGAKLLAGENLTFNGSAETDGSFFIYGGRGVDSLYGGAKNDVFLFGSNGHFGASDVVNGGVDGIDQLALRGSYTLTFGAGQMIGIESLGLLSAQDTRYGPLGSNYNYNLTTHDGNVAAGVQMVVDGAKLRGGETLVFNGSAELDGSFWIIGGVNGDTLAGSQNGDILQGKAGADMLTGNGGADIFRYASAADSDGLKMDRILDFTPGTDRIDLARIDANSLAAGDQAFTWIGTGAFTGVAGQLRAMQSGSDWFLLGDTNGDSMPEFVVQLTLQGPTPLGATDFIL